MSDQIIADALRKMAQTAIDLSKQCETLEVTLRDANEVCRSAYQVAARGGKETNWPALTQRIGDSLDRQHAILFPSLATGEQPK